MLGTIDEADTTGRSTTQRFRSDVDGLRAVAILLIIGFHVGLPRFDGGYIGVDVFFVISGYLITRNLLGSDRVRPITFWARRLRRLVPALSVMVLVTLLASVVVLPSIDISRIAKEGAASAVYASNILFARATQDYFAADVNESPFLHTWSLGVEEQFYLVWPLLFVGCAFLVRHRRHLMRQVLVVCFLAILVASFAFNVQLTNSGSPWAFFSLPTRAWEFAAAGLLAALWPSFAVRSVALRTAMAIGGLVMVGVATLTFGADTPYPGTAALLPVIGTVLVIMAGETAGTTSKTTFVSAGLSTAPMQWFGRISYSWYLWHWPLIILTVSAFDDRMRYRAAAAAVSLPIAYATHRLVENPVRFSARFTRSNPRTYILGATATIAVLIVAFGIVNLQSSTPAPTSLDSKLVAARDRGEAGCQATKSASGISYCLGGDLSSETVVLFTGDSHASVWTDAVGRAGADLGVRVASRFLPGCPPIPLSVKPQRQGAGGPEACEAKRRDDERLMTDLEPAAVILAQYDGYLGYIMDAQGNVPDESAQVAIWTDAYRKFIENTRDAGAAVGILRDNPALDFNPLKCIANADRVDVCEPTRDEAMAKGKELRAGGRSAIDALGRVPTLELIDLICTDEVCRLEFNNVLVYTDTDHLAHLATLEFEPDVQQLLDQTINN